MALDLITGHQGVAHISAEQISTINKAMMDGYGDNKVMRMKNGTLTQDGLAIEVATGYWRANGFDIEVAEEETVYIDPSSIGTSRIDNIYVELLQDIPTGAQRAEIVTVQGEEAASDPVPPDDPTVPYLNTDILLDVIPLAAVTVTEGAMVLTDLTEDFDLVTPAELAVVDGKAVAAQTSANEAQQMIAPIEEGPDASQAYAIGEQFIYDGMLHVAKSAIAQNDTLVEDGNMEIAPVVADQLASLKASLSHIGMIIHSTTLDTEAKVKAIYGGTTWIQHSGYVLRGAASGVVANSATKTGGQDDAIIPYHTHTVNGGSHRHTNGAVTWASSGGNLGFNTPGFGNSKSVEYTGYDGGHTHDCSYAGTSGNTTNANLPNYKSVYIWERIA